MPLTEFGGDLQYCRALAHRDAFAKTIRSIVSDQLAVPGGLSKRPRIGAFIRYSFGLGPFPRYEPSMFEKYFQDEGVNPGFEKEFISLFNGWLGMKNLHKLDEITEVEWARSNSLLRQIQQNYHIYFVDLEARVCRQINDIETIIGSHKDSMDKEYAQFTKIVIPELDAVYTEEDDYTWILWHKNNGAVEALSPLIMGAGLFHWRDACTQNST